MKIYFLLLPIFLVSCGAKTSKNTNANNGTSADPILHSKVIYGEDNRKDLYDVHDPALLALADSTVALVKPEALQDVGGGHTRISGRTFGNFYNLCPQEPFREQTSAAFCSGFLVAPDVVVTAGHCVVDQASCGGIKFVFGFAKKIPNQVDNIVQTEDVYGCKTLVKRDQQAQGQDFAIVKLDRSVTGHAVLRMRQSGVIATGEPLVLIGHPSGIPTKVTDGANVRSVTANEYFVANTDSYGGNSGSAVFNASTHMVEGILVRGEQDFEGTAEECLVSKVCTNSGCRGEDVTKIEVIRPIVKKLLRKK